jgi:hypothetical protein
VAADLLEWRPPRPVDAVLCRGVLNDLAADADRVAAFARWLRPGGDRRLRFTAETALDPARRLVLVARR